MTELHEETHYQIALTNRQVLIAFVALLACLFLAFFAGAWIGRDSTPSAPGLAALSADETAAGEERLSFFGQTADGRAADGLAGQTAAPPAEPATPPPARATRQRKKAALPPPEPMKRATPSEAPPKTSDDLRRASETDRGAKRQQREAKPAAADQAVIQVHAGTDRAQAEDLVKRLKAAGYQSFLVEIDGAQPYRVRVGPFGNRDLARARANQLEKELGLETYIPPIGL